MVATKRGEYPRADDGVEVRRMFHELRSRAIENGSGQFKAVFDGYAGVPTKGLANTTRHVLGAVFVYQLALLYRHEHEQPLRVGLKPFLKAASFMTRPHLSATVCSCAIGTRRGAPSLLAF